MTVCLEWDGMLGVFLRLYNPTLPELQVEWRLREHAKEPSYLAKWYGVVWEVLQAKRDVRDRYAHVHGGLWPNAMPTGV